MAVDDAMADLLFDRPFVELAGDRLVLRSGTAEAHFQEAIGEPIRTDGDDDDAGVAQSGDATCGIGLSPSVDSRATEPLENGPADPPVVHTGWAPDEASGQGVWNVVHGDQRVEIHVPGLMVDDLLGERTEEVLLGDMWAATVWFTDEWVQVRHFGDGFEGSCTSFTITATGSTEEANRDTAMAIASSLRTWECPCPEDSSEPLAPESGTQPEPTIPSADDGEDIDLRGWYGNTGPMVLAAVEVDDVVTPAVDTPFGGGMADTDGGPIALVARVDEGGLELRGCEVVALSLDEHDGRPSVGLLSGSYSSEGCAPDAGEQWGQVLTILSLGPVTRTVETGDGPMLLLSTDEGTALFHRFPPR